jgi:hypothetical protein
MIATRHLVELGAVVILGALAFAIGYNGELLLAMLVALVGAVLLAGAAIVVELGVRR